MSVVLLASLLAPASPSRGVLVRPSPATFAESEYVPFKGATDSIYFWVAIGNGGTEDAALTAGTYEMGVTLAEPAIQIATAGAYTGFFGFWWPDLLPVPVGVSEDQGAPKYSFYLRAPWPNPARGAVRIAFGVGAEANVSLVAYDLTGRRVATLAQGRMEPGDYTVVWRDAPAGVYVIRYEAGSYRAQVKVIRR